MPRCTWPIEEKLRVVAAANKISLPEGLVSDLLGDGEIMTTGVQGDQRTYTPVIRLMGMFPGWAAISRVSTAITNTLPINRVVWVVACRDENGEPIFFTGRCPKCFSANLYDNDKGFGCDDCQQFFPN